MIISILCVGCNAVNVIQSLHEVESYIMERPDSALAVLDSMDRAFLTTDRLKAHHALLYAMALDKNYIDVSDDSIAKVAVDYFSRRGSSKYRARSLYYLGVAYYYQGAYDKAILEFTKAEEIARKCDSLYWGMAKSFQGGAYDRCYNNHEELKCLQKAYDIYSGLSDKYKLQVIILRLARLYSSISDYSKAENLFTQLINSSAVDEHIRLYALCGYAFMSVSNSDIDKALSIYDEIINHQPKVMSDQDYWAYSYALNKAGRKYEAHVFINQLDNTTADAFYWLYRIHKDNEDYINALSFLEESNQKDNTIIEESLSQSLSLAQRNYYESAYKLSQYKAKNKSITTAIVFVASLFFICIILLVAKRQVRIKDEEKERTLLYADEIRRQLEESLKDDYPSLRKKYFDLYKSKFETIGVLYEQFSLSFGKNNAEQKIYEKVASIVSDFKKEYSNSSDLEVMLNADLDNIISHLRAEIPKIKAIDVSMFCFMAIGFDVTTISHLMNVSMNTIYIRKSRLRQKIELLSPKHMDQFLQVIG